MKGEECETYLVPVVQRQKHTFEGRRRTKERERKAVLNGDRGEYWVGHHLFAKHGLQSSPWHARAKQKMILIGPLGPRRRDSRTRVGEESYCIRSMSQSSYLEVAIDCPYC